MKEFEFTKGEWGNYGTLIKCNGEVLGFTSTLKARVDETRLKRESLLSMMDRIRKDRLKCDDEENANANLMASAPDLLYALIDLVEIVDNLPENKSILTALDNAKKAIDKATK